MLCSLQLARNTAISKLRKELLEVLKGGDLSYLHACMHVFEDDQCTATNSQLHLIELQLIQCHGHGRLGCTAVSVMLRTF